ncbi:MAG: ABC transporter permease [Magnetococcales bacterium]|nr:ABC transporter permease [Magnetococcales bacterium]
MSDGLERTPRSGQGPGSEAPAASVGEWIRGAASEYVQGVRLWPLWLGLAVRDIRIRYKRTLLGPLWITLSMALTFTMLGMLFSALLENDIHHSLPHLAAGLATWGLVSGAAMEGPHIFVHSQHLIRSLRLPLTVHVLRQTTLNFFIFFHNALAALAAFVLLGGELNAAMLFWLVGLPVTFVTLFSGGLIFAILGARFRDLGPMVAVAMQLLFYMTPILWSPSDLPMARKYWITLNPLHHVIEMVRAPMLGRMPEPLSLGVAVGAAVVLGAGAFFLLGASRRRIAYWL